MILRVIEAFTGEPIDEKTELMPAREPEERTVLADIHGITIEDLLMPGMKNISSARINGQWQSRGWEKHIINRNDEIELYVDSGAWAIPYIISVVISMVLSMALSFIMKALTPTPTKPPKPGQPSTVLPGVTNTVAAGTPKIIILGRRLVYPHLIGVQAEGVGPNGGPAIGVAPRSIKYHLLYSGVVGPVANMYGCRIDSTRNDQVGVDDDSDGGNWTSGFLRGGDEDADKAWNTDDPDNITLFTDSFMTYTENKTIPKFNKEDQNKTQPVYYTTKGRPDKVVLFINFPGGINRKAGLHHGSVQINIDFIRAGDLSDNYVPAPDSGWPGPSPFRIRENTTYGFMELYPIIFPEKGRQWTIRLTQHKMRKGYDTPDPVLANVMEEWFIQTRYPGNAIMIVRDLGAAQIPNGVEGSQIGCIIEGSLHDVWVPELAAWRPLAYSRDRAFNTRFLLLDKRNGLGNMTERDLVNDSSFVAGSQYWAEDAVGIGGVVEPRSLCDAMINEQQPGHDHIKRLLFEGDAILVPSGGKLTLVIDKAGEPTQKFSEPGNIIPDTLKMEMGTERPINTINFEFPYAATGDPLKDDYKMIPAKYVDPLKRNSEPERPESISYGSIVRKSEATRRTIRYLREQQIELRWSFRATREAMRTLPKQKIWLSYNELDRTMYVGFVMVTSAVSELRLDKLVTLADGETYAVLLLHVADGSIEKRDITTLPGQVGIIDVSPNFTNPPVRGDRWTIGNTQNFVPRCVVDDIRPQSDGTYELDVHLYKPEDYDICLQDPTESINTTETLSVPIPLLRVQAVGSGGTWEFRVVPGFSPMAGNSVASTATTITLATAEPAHADHFVGAYIFLPQIDVERFVSEYTGGRKVTADQPWGVSVPGGAYYIIRWRNFASFYKFKVEMLNTSTGQYEYLTESDPNSMEGPYFKQLTGQGSISGKTFRFTPISPGGQANYIGRWIVNATGSPDLTAPPAPEAVFLQAGSSTGVAQVSVLLPLERDYRQLEVEWYTGSIGGTLVASTFQQLQRDDTLAGQIQIEVTEDLSSLDFGTEIFARARAWDYYDNASAWTDAPNSAILQDDEVNNPEIPGDEEGQELDSVGNGSPVTGTTAETTLYQFTVKGGLLGARNALQTELFTQVIDNAGNDNVFTLRFYYGDPMGIPTLIATITARSSDLADFVGTVPWDFETILKGNGATDDQVGSLAKTSGTEIGGISQNPTSGPAQEDSTVDLDIIVTVQLSNTAASIQLLSARTLFFGQMRFNIALAQNDREFTFTHDLGHINYRVAGAVVAPPGGSWATAWEVKEKLANTVTIAFADPAPDGGASFDLWLEE